ncbi:MAG: hypothetical protein R2748_15940 [Bryobacterales bacterium]
MPKFAAGIVLFCAVCAVLLADDLSTYQPLMKGGAAATAALGKSVEAGNADEALKQSRIVADYFGGMAAFWSQKNAEDAVASCVDVITKANEIAAMAEAKNLGGATAKLDELRANCKTCHAAHRDKAADGTWVVK